ncbi:MAG: phosphomannose isomerase type II C-terminal cupin domain [Deltaproteobacteria bacterium]|nr:phosphomannose isomerase type II C-terminal cupin domain [Deltaproteobacteria bacterium]
MYGDERPWGYFEVLLDEDRCKVKRIIVHPGRRLSLQYHRRRAEHWYVVYGTGIVTRDDERIEVGPGSSVDIAREQKHRVESTGKSALVFIEVQTGD